MRLCGSTLGNLIPSLPDGEPGSRSIWINFLAHKIYDPHPDLETLHRPRVVPGLPDWMPKGYDDHWLFRVKDKAKRLCFDDLGYSGEAVESYGTFRSLRDSGVISSGVRFQVSMPLTDDATRPFAAEPADYEIMADAYEEAMKREVATLTSAISPSDLVIQWDIVFEVMDFEARPENRSVMPWYIPTDDPMKRYLRRLHAVSEAIPSQTLLGVHICYGDLGHQHVVQPKNLGICVRIANESAHSAGRPLNFVHMPVPRDRNDDAYFEPLRDLEIGDTKLYAGLVHYTDGVEGTRRRLEAFRRHYKGNAGVSTECGFGRRKLETIPPLLEIHREIIEFL